MNTTIGAIVGGYAGEPITGRIDKAAELAFWRQHHDGRPYARGAASFEQYEPAYAYALDAYDKTPGHPFDDIEPHLSRGWPAARGTSTLAWEHAAHAARDAWARLSDTDARHPVVGP